MWSKQADVRNAEVTSPKGKPGGGGGGHNRKQKSHKISTSSDGSESAAAATTNTPTTKKQQKSGKHRNRSNKKSSQQQQQPQEKASIELKAEEVAVTQQPPLEQPEQKTADEVTVVDEDDPEMADVVLRTLPPSSDLGDTTDQQNLRNQNSNNAKRYSDSFVIENHVSGDVKCHRKSQSAVHQLVNGLLVLPEELADEKAAKKGRRFSDIFRHGVMKAANSMENLNFNQFNHHKPSAQTKQVTSKSTSSSSSNKKAQSAKQTSASNNSSKAKDSTKKDPSGTFVAPENPSYLKRVKSKIYKSSSAKSNNNNSNTGGGDAIDGTILPSKTSVSSKKNGVSSSNNNNNCDRIPEDAAVENKPARKTSHFDGFRLIRQTSNLEQIRSRTFGVLRSSASNTGIAAIGDGSAGEDDGMDADDITAKPKLAKAKSSSAINLNLLRTRRNRILEQVKERRCKDVFNEFEFIAFGGFYGSSDKFGGSQRITSIQDDTMPFRPDEKIPPDLGENRPSQPVSRSGSDRRPDVVREEISKNTEGSANIDHGHVHDKQDSDSATPDSMSVINFPPTASSKKRSSSNINRSESVKEQTEKRKQRRNISDPSHSSTQPVAAATSGDVELDQPGLSNTDSGSSSNSSISFNGRLSDSPSNSVDVIAVDGGDGRKHSSDWESDTEMEPSNWQKLLPEEELRNLHPEEKKRQDVINELFHTESTHVRNLRVLYEIFYKSLLASQTLKADELALIFPNIKETLHVHTQLNREMKRRRRDDPLVRNLGDMLVGMFGGATGESLQKAAAQFCERQQLALEFIKERRKRDSKFDAVLVECEKRRQCRRLPLQGIIPTEMQRLSKYPLLLERLMGSFDASDPLMQDELARLRRAHHFSKEILNYVNEAAKLALNRARLEEIQRHLDTASFERSEHPITSEFKNLDLTRYKLVVEGNMRLRRPNKPLVPVHVLLLEEAVIILQKEGEKFLLKCFQSGNPQQPTPLSPITKMSTLLPKKIASQKDTLLLLNTAHSQMVELVAEDEAKRDVWFKHFTDASNAHKLGEGGKSQRPEPPPDSDDSETVQELPSARDVAERAEAVVSTATDDNPTEDDDDDTAFSDAQEGRLPEGADGASSSEGGGAQTRITADEWPLIQPSQVHVEVPPVHVAETRLTLIEQISRKGKEVQDALKAKEDLIADLLNIPREDFPVIADMASDTKDALALALAAVHREDQLHLAVNKALTVTEATAVAATGGKHTACQSQEVLPTTPQPNIPAALRDIANLLSSQLMTTLLDAVKELTDDRDRLRKELCRTREQLHEHQSVHPPSMTNEIGVSASPTPETHVDLESIKESPTESES